MSSTTSTSVAVEVDHAPSHSVTGVDQAEAHTSQCSDCAELVRITNETRADLHSARTRVQELEEQVAIMTAKATAAVDKLADYEDKLKRLSTGAAIRALPTLPTASPSSTPERLPKRSSHLFVERPEIQRPATADGAVMTTSERGQVKERRPTPPSKFPSFSFWGKKEPVVQVERAVSPLSATGKPDGVKSTPRSSTSSADSAEAPARKTSSTSTASATTPVAPDPSYTTEHALRLAAEAKLATLQAELEDLSATLFEQANTMVAEERRLRAKTEAQVKELQKWGQQAEEKIRTLSSRRDEEGRTRQEKDERLRKLDERMGRIERVRRAVQGVG